MSIVYGTLFIFGLLLGSFLNVIALRFGFREARRPRSACPSCGAALQWFELIPVVSFLFQGGVCRHCKSKLSLQYPLVELGTGALFMLAAGAIQEPINAFSIAAFGAMLLFLSVFFLLVIYDIRHTLVPLHFAGVLFLSALAFRIIETLDAHSFDPLVFGTWGALALGGFFALLVAITRGKGMGVGDIYVASSVGMFFGLARGIETVTIAFWVGALVGIFLLAASRVAREFFPHAQLPILPQGVRMKSEVPFVPFLFAATLFAIVAPFSLFLFVERLLTV